MKRCLSSFIIIAILFVIFSNMKIIAESEQVYYNVQIPIFYGDTRNFSTEMLNGITTSQESIKGKIFISIDDFQKLSNTELIMSSNNRIELKRNTVFLKLKANDEVSDLYLGYDEKNYIKSFRVKVPTIYYKNKAYISLIHGLNVFSIDTNIIDKEDILNMISVNKKVNNNDYLNSSIEYLDEKIFNFDKNSKFLQISQSSPFDKFYLEYNKNSSDYLFSWQSLAMLNDVTVSLGAIPSNFISNYDGIFDFVVGSYDSDKRYYDILCTIINNDKSSEEIIDFSIVYKTITFLSDTSLLNTIVNGNDVLTFIISSVSDCMKASEKTVNLIRCSEYQDKVLDKTILNSCKLKEEMMDDKIITDFVNFSIFNKYVNNTYLSSLYNNQYALYESANKLNKDIDNPIKNISTEWYRDMIYKTLTSIADEGLNVVTGGATEIPDILMKNIKYNNVINNLILEPSEVLNNVKDCYFIQETVKNVCNSDIFNETENSYYNFKLMLQSSLTAYEILKENDTLMKIVGVDGKNLITEKIDNINSILNNIENCDITFYSTSDISNEMVDVKDISIMVVPLEETNSTEIVEIEEIENYEWYLEPKIEADNIIVPNYDNELYEKYAIIEKNGKYGLISNKGDFIEDIKYNNFLICPLNVYIVGNGDVGDFELDDKENIGYKIENEKLIKVNHPGHGIGDITYYYYNKDDNKTYVVPQVGDNYKEYKDDSVVLAQGVSMKIEEDGTYTFKSFYDEWYLVNSNGKINDNIYECGNNYLTSSCSNNIIYAKNNNEWYYFNNKGEQIIFDKIKLNYMESGRGHIIANRVNKNNAISCPFLDVDGVIAVNTKDGGCFYDINGDKLTDITDFEEVRPMINGFAWVKKDGKWGVIRLKYDNQIEELNSWQTLYSQYLSNGEYKQLGTGFANVKTGEEHTLTDEDTKFQLAYIDNDDIPELIISGGYSVHILTIKNNELIQLKKDDNNVNFSWYGCLTYREKEGLFLDDYQRMGIYETPVYKLENGECLLQDNIEYYESIESAKINQSFFINNEEVSLDDYVNKLKKWRLNTYFTKQYPEYNIENDNWKVLYYSDGYEVTESNINIIKN